MEPCKLGLPAVFILFLAVTVRLSSADSLDTLDTSMLAEPDEDIRDAAFDNTMPESLIRQELMDSPNMDDVYRVLVKREAKKKTKTSGTKTSTEKTTTATATDFTTRTPTQIAPPDGSQAIFDSEGYPCILSELRASFEITFPTKPNKKSGAKRGTKTVTVSMPNMQEGGAGEVITSGVCEPTDTMANITYSWGKEEHFQLTVTFEKGKAGRNEVWRIQEFSFKYDRSDTVFNGTFLDGGQPVVTSNPKKLHFQVSHEMSLACDAGKHVDMAGKSKEEGFVVMTIHHMKMQSFIGTSGTYGEVYWCRPEFDERVPIAVGSVMAVMTVLTVIGYAVFRRFRPKKADYDTME